MDAASAESPASDRRVCFAESAEASSEPTPHTCRRPPRGESAALARSSASQLRNPRNPAKSQPVRGWVVLPHPGGAPGEPHRVRPASWTIQARQTGGLDMSAAEEDLK